MALSTLVTLAAIGLSQVVSATPDHGDALAQARPQVGAQGGETMTTPQGCTYRRTKVPGLPERWILVLDAAHQGQTNALTRCPGMR
ncbi:MAG: hypothetical protein QNJ09_16770 [Paracoccaceae bacterium]|nr:hypothetical protein [Paracoccaceae bacterium]